MIQIRIADEADAEAISAVVIRSLWGSNAEGFYQKLGYQAVREELYVLERTIIMTKTLAT